MNRPPRFVADAMLGRLGRYLTLAGFDCRYCPGIDDDKLKQLHERTQRRILTRDRELHSRLPTRGSQLVDSDSLVGRLREVKQQWELTFRCGSVFRRCPNCRTRLRVLPAKGFGDRLPPRTRQWVRMVLHCGMCDEIFWQGSHYQDVVEFLDQSNLLDDKPRLE